jgi:transposase
MPHILGVERDAVILFPQSLDAYITEENPVRFIDAFVDTLDLEELGFVRAGAAERGRWAYHPADLLKLYIYGYLNRIRSSRLLEREAQRNLELIWLLRKLQPDFKTIADFRNDNLEPLKATCRMFTLLCKDLDLFGAALVAIDGSKFQAQNNAKRNFNDKRLVKLLTRIDEQIAEYLAALDSDGTSTPPILLSRAQLHERIATLRERHQRYTELRTELAQSEQTQVSLTDPDSRSIRVAQGTQVCYNVQIAVDNKHTLIVTHNVVNDVTDKNQLLLQAVSAKAELGVEQLAVVADSGFTNAEQFEQCEAQGIRPYVAKSRTTRNQRDGLFTKADFVYNKEIDTYRCPQGETLTFRFETVEKGRPTRYSTTSACRKCPIKTQCTKGKEGRRITRSGYEAAADRVYERVRLHPEVMKQRKAVVEHVFGTLKRAMNHGSFLLRTCPKVAAEVSLSVLTYNIKRVVTILGVPKLLEALKYLRFAFQFLLALALEVFFRFVLKVFRLQAVFSTPCLLFFTQSVALLERTG